MASRLNRYLLYQQLGVRNANETPTECFVCQCHGDLHSRNILVSTVSPPTPIIIDWSDYEASHWAVDYARLLVDLLLSAYDAGPVSYEWSHIARWRELARGVVAGNVLPDDGHDSNRLVRTAVNWMITNIGAACPAVESVQDLNARRWEWQLALAVEFMRGGYSLGLTTPKRVFALLASADTITAAEQSLPNRP